MAVSIINTCEDSNQILAGLCGTSVELSISYQHVGSFLGRLYLISCVCGKAACQPNQKAR